MFDLLTRRVEASAPKSRISGLPMFEPSLRGVVTREREHFAREAGVNDRIRSPATTDFLAKAS